jgi:hypothetical protein
MAKLCADPACAFPVFSHGYCRNHQHLRPGWKETQDARRAKIKASKLSWWKKKKESMSDNKMQQSSSQTPSAPRKENWRYRRKTTGELKLFREIWAERVHQCTHCKIKLEAPDNTGDFVKMFAHIKSKGAYPELRLEKGNIMIHCFECHRQYDQETKDRYEKRKNLYH